MSSKPVHWNSRYGTVNMVIHAVAHQMTRSNFSGSRRYFQYAMGFCRHMRHYGCRLGAALASETIQGDGSESIANRFDQPADRSNSVVPRVIPINPIMTALTRPSRV